MALYCSACGASLAGETRTFAPPVASLSLSRARPLLLLLPGLLLHPGDPLTRPLVGRKLAGVCRGLGDDYGWDVTLIRVIAVLLAILVFPVGLVAYALFWVMVPEEPRAVAPTTNLNTTT